MVRVGAVSEKRPERLNGEACSPMTSTVVIVYSCQYQQAAANHRFMTLSSELISRLQAPKALLDLGDVELASYAAARLQAHREIGSVAQIIECFDTHRYAEAGRIITTALTEGSRLVRWTDPEIILLEAEFERLSSELAEAESEQSELTHKIACFHAAHHQTLGARLAKL